MSTLTDRLTDVGYAAGWSAVRHLPEPAAQALFRRLADNAWRRRGPRVRQLERNLARALGPDAPAEQLQEVTRAAMRSYMRYWLEIFRLPDWSMDEINARAVSDGVPRIEKTYASGRGMVLALPHMGNWDHAGAWVVQFTGGRLTTVQERLKPESLFDRFMAFRASIGIEALPLTGGERNPAGVLARRLRAGGLVCLLADRDLTASGIPVDFMGEKTTMPPGPAALALSTGAELIPVIVTYDGPRTRITFHEEIPPPATGTRQEKVAAMTQAMADRFAASIREKPEDWHMLQRLWLADQPRRPGGPESVPAPTTAAVPAPAPTPPDEAAPPDGAAADGRSVGS